MRRIHLTAAVLSLAAMAWAQTPKANTFHLYDGSTEYTSRGFLGSNPGECLQKIPASHFGYLRKAVQFNVVLQDQSKATAEEFYLIFRKVDPATGGPDVTGHGVLYLEGPYKIAGSGTGVGAWALSYTLKKAVKIPAEGCFYGVYWSKPVAKPGWYRDGGSVHMSGYYPRKACGEHPRKGVATNLAWNVIYHQTLPPYMETKICGGNRAWNMSLGFASPVLQGYAVDPAAKCAGRKGKPDYGYAALWPDLTDLEKYGYLANFGWRIRAANYPGAVAVLLVSPTVIRKGVEIPGVGLWYLHPFSVIAFSGKLSSKGVAVTPAIDPGYKSYRAFLAGTNLYAQGGVFGKGKFALTNWVGMEF